MDEQVELFLSHLGERRGLAAKTKAAYRTDHDQFNLIVHDYLSS
jgi:site-specific recombinase XerD